jgi:hypothetical protein
MNAKPVRTEQPKVKTERLKIVPSHYILKLYVAGQSPKSVNAIANIKKSAKRICKGVMSWT